MRLLHLVIFLLVIGNSGSGWAASYDYSRSDDRPLSDLRPEESAYLDQQLGPLADERQAFEAVTSKIGTNLYLGIMRGHHGVLHARSGNSLEKSLLLAYLLKQKGFGSRIATATLSAESMDKLIAAQERFFADLARETVPPEETLARLEAEAETDHEREWIEAARSLLAAIDRRTLELFRQIKAIVSPSLAGSETIADANAARQRAEFRRLAGQHYWLQVSVGDAWVDLDPTLALAWGEAPAPPAATMSIAEATRANTYLVTIAIDATYQIPGMGRRTKRALEFRAPADAIAAYPIAMTHPARDDQVNVLGLAPAFEALGSSAGGINYYPTLFVAGAAFNGDVLKHDSWDAGSFFGGKKPNIALETLTIRIEGPEGNVSEASRDTFDFTLPGEREKPDDQDWLLQEFDTTPAEVSPGRFTIANFLRAIYTIELRTFPVIPALS